MKITFYATVNLWGSFLGGAAAYERRIVEALSKQHDVTVVFGSSEDTSQTLPRRVRVKKLPVSGSSPLSRVAAALQASRSDADLIVDCSDHGGPWLSPLFSNTSKLLLAHQLWQDIFHRELPAPVAHAVSAMEPHLYRFYTHVPTVANSQSTADSMRSLGIRKIEIIPPGIDELFLQRTKTRTKKAKHPTLAVLCRLRAYKGVHFALACFRMILEKYPDARLKILGDGPDMSRLRTLAVSLGIHDSVDFLGRVDDSAKIYELSNAHLLINTSIREGFGINVLEANSCYTPCVGWNVPGTRDAIRDTETGVLVPPFSTSCLCEAVLELLSDRPKMLNMGQTGRNWSEQFTWTDTCKRFEAFLTSLN